MLFATFVGGLIEAFNLHNRFKGKIVHQPLFLYEFFAN